jgi:E3 ubiquitin-protein ligase HUWE1
VDSITKASDDELVGVLRQVQSWQYPRGDLHHWITILDRFDALLADIVTQYGLKTLQRQDFTPESKDLVMEILRIYRSLLENCTNRKLFASYDVGLVRALLMLATE